MVDADALGLSFEALVFITMRQEDRETLIGFEAGVRSIPHVVQAQRLFGDPDYLLRIVTTDLAAYQRLQDGLLSALPGRAADDIHAGHEADRAGPAAARLAGVRCHRTSPPLAKILDHRVRLGV